MSGRYRGDDRTVRGAVTHDADGTDAGAGDGDDVRFANVESPVVELVSEPGRSRRAAAAPQTAGAIIEDALADLLTLAMRTTGAVVSASARTTARTAGRAVSFAADTPPGRIAKRSAKTLLASNAGRAGDAVVSAGETLEEQMNKFLGFLVPAVIDAVDPQVLIDKVDMNALLERVDVDRLLGNVDIDALIGRVDVEALMERVDVDAIVDRVDVNAIVDRANIGDIVAQSTQQVAGSTLDVARRQIVGLDVILLGVFDRLLRRDPATMQPGPEKLVGS